MNLKPENYYFLQCMTHMKTSNKGIEFVEGESLNLDFSLDFNVILNNLCFT